MEIKRGIDRAVEVVIGELKKISKPCQAKTEISQVGTISANNDKTIGDLIAEAMEKVGKDGVITVEEAKSMSTSLDVGWPIAADTTHTVIGGNQNTDTVKEAWDGLLDEVRLYAGVVAADKIAAEAQ